MKGVDDEVMNRVLDEHGRGRHTVEELWGFAVEAGAISESEALAPFKNEIIRKFYQRRNRDLDLEGVFDQKLFAFTRKLEAGGREEYHQEWGGTTVAERVELYAVERKKWTNQGRKAREIYDRATNDFGAAEGRQFRQRALKFGSPPEVEVQASEI